MITSAKLHEAVLFVDKKHAGQVRRGTGAAYTAHVIAVSYIVAAFKRSGRLIDLLIAALLHDTLEDTDTTYEELVELFGKFIADLVQELSNDEAQIALMGKLAYQTKKLLAMSSYALVIKLADRLANIVDHPTKNMVRDTLVLMQSLKQGRKLSKTHIALIIEIEMACLEKQGTWAKPTQGN